MAWPGIEKPVNLGGRLRTAPAPHPFPQVSSRRPAPCRNGSSPSAPCPGPRASTESHTAPEARGPATETRLPCPVLCGRTRGLGSLPTHPEASRADSSATPTSAFTPRQRGLCPSHRVLSNQDTSHSAVRQADTSIKSKLRAGAVAH